MTAPLIEAGRIVTVVDGRPRYHVATCRHVAAKPAEDITVEEARTAGFTPCGVCKPDAEPIARMPRVPRQREIPALTRPPMGSTAQQPSVVATRATEVAPAVPRKGSGLAITAFVLAVVAVTLFWVPIVNNFAFFLAVVGLCFGIPALVSARRGKRTGGGMALASVMLAVLAMIGVLATQALYAKAIDDITGSLESSASGQGTAPDIALSEKPLALGQSAVVGDYRVTVTKVVADADALIAAANEFNSKPKNRYTLVSATVTYLGDRTGSPWIDLRAAILGSDHRQYAHGASLAVSSRSDESMVELGKGGSSDVEFVMDLPPSSLVGGQVLIEKPFSFKDRSALWSVG